jgi:hypothetical protein
MGAYWSVYLGVYLEVQEGKETKEVTHYVDSDGRNRKTPFDPNSGEKFEEKTVQEEKTVYPRPCSIDVDGFSEDEFFNPEYSGAPKGCRTWIPNKGDYMLARMGQHEDNPNKEVDDIDVLKLRSQFVDDYSDYLQELSKHFNFTVKFGLVHYAH